MDKTITLPYEEYLQLKHQAEKQMNSLFGMTYEEIEKMKVDYENLQIKLADIRLWHDKVYNKQQEVIGEFNSLPWYKRMFKRIEL